jgi:hypothetical protein
VVFVTGDARRDYVGMARPHVIRRRITAARAGDRDEDVYRKAEALTDEATKDLPDADSPQVRLPAIAKNWKPAYQAIHSTQDVPFPPEPVPSLAQRVTPQELRRLLRDGLSTTSVKWDGPGTTLDYYQILDCGEEFVALTGQAQPQTGQARLQVVSASRMATEISRQVLRKQLEGGR